MHIMISRMINIFYRNSIFPGVFFRIRAFAFLLTFLFLPISCDSFLESPEKLIRPYPMTPLILSNMDGEETSTDLYKNRVILLHFFTTWCPPCVEEIPSLNELQELYKDSDLVILGVNMGEPRSTVQKFIDSHSIHFPVLLDTNEGAYDIYGFENIPHSLIISRSGDIVALHAGILSWTGKRTRKMLNQFLNEKIPEP